MAAFFVGLAGSVSGPVFASLQVLGQGFELRGSLLVLLAFYAVWTVPFGWSFQPRAVSIAQNSPAEFASSVVQPAAQLPDPPDQGPSLTGTSRCPGHSRCELPLWQCPLVRGELPGLLRGPAPCRDQRPGRCGGDRRRCSLAFRPGQGGGPVFELPCH